MKGKDQTEAMRQLVEPWQPDELAGFRVGDLVRLPNVKGALSVVGLKSPSLLLLRTPHGAIVKAGWRACERVRISQRINVSSAGDDE